MGRDLLEAGDRGEIPIEEGFQLLWNYTGAAFDTTANAIGNLLWLLTEHPQVWNEVREDPAMVPSIIEEGLRLESPIQIWGRWCPREATVGASTVPAGSRIALLLAAANRDERMYAEPTRFDPHRNLRNHLAFGHGVHLCVGAALARLELESLFGALAARVRTIELDGDPVRRLNNTVRGFAALPIRFL